MMLNYKQIHFFGVSSTIDNPCVNIVAVKESRENFAKTQILISAFS